MNKRGQTAEQVATLDGNDSARDMIRNEPQKRLDMAKKDSSCMVLQPRLGNDSPRARGAALCTRPG